MNRGIDHHAVFFDPSDRIEFGQRLADIHDRFGVATHAYCLVNNHYHALMHCPGGQLSDAMQRLGSTYTRHVDDRLGRDGALFRGRFRSRLITDDSYLLAAGVRVDRVRAMVQACSLVSEEIDGGRGAGRVGRPAALAWADRIGVEPTVVMEALAISNLGALRSATHRARRRVGADRRIGEVVDRAADLTAPLRARLGSDPWRDRWLGQRAARAAS